MTPAKLFLQLNLLVCIVLTTFITACEDDDDTESKPKITITSFSPTTARVGEAIVITGTGFSAERPANTVTFTGNASATVVRATATELEVSVPQGAANGPITVTVNGKSATSEQSFTLDTSLGEPRITAIAPANGFIGTTITITGQNFSTDIESLVVLFDAVEAEITSASVTEIKAVVPQGLPNGEVSVTVKRDDMTSQSATFVVDPLPVSVKVTYWSSILNNTINRGVITENGVAIEELYNNGDGVNGPAGVAIDVTNEMIYWINQGSIEIMKAPMDGSGPVEVIFDMNDGILFPTDIAYNAANNAIYFTDFVDDTHQYIRKGNLSDGTLENVYAINEFTVPSGIKITVAENKLYWTDNYNGTVYEGSMDGDVANLKLLYDQTDGLSVPASIAVDPANERIYIVDNPDPGATATDAIYVGALNGEGTLTRIVEAGDELSNANDIEIDLENGFIFWINSESNGNIKRAKTDGTSVETLFGGIDKGYFFDLDIR